MTNDVSTPQSGANQETATGREATPAPSCSFCGQPLATKWRVVAGPGVYICSDCLQSGVRIVAEGATPSLDESATFRVAVRQPDGTVQHVAYGPLPEPGEPHAPVPNEVPWLVVCPVCGTWNVGPHLDVCLQCAARLPRPGEPANQPAIPWQLGFSRKELRSFNQALRASLEQAQAVAAEVHHAYIGTEHLLLGLLRQRENVAAAVLTGQGIVLDAVQQAALRIIAPGGADVTTVKTYSQRAHEVVRRAMDVAAMLGQASVDPGHLLLALIWEGKGVAAQVLRELGIDLDAVRQQVLQRLTGRQTGVTPARRFAKRAG